MKIRKYLLLANIVLTAFIGWAAYGVYGTWSVDRQKAGFMPGESANQSSKETRIGRSQGLGHYQAVVNQDIFGTAAQKPAGAVIQKPRIEEIQVTRRNLLLKGTVVGEGNQSYAVISEGKSVEGSVYRMNDSLQNARIVEILHRVILDAEGKREALILTYDLVGSGGKESGVTQLSEARQAQPSIVRSRRSPILRRMIGEK